jgi:hypothetical protein
MENIFIIKEYEFIHTRYYITPQSSFIISVAFTPPPWLPTPQGVSFERAAAHYLGLRY